MRGVTYAVPDESLRLRLPATPASASTLRTEIRRWLEALGTSSEDILDLQLACSEALQRVLEQGARPVALVVDVEAGLEGSTVTVTIRDYGLCRVVQPDDEAEQTFSLALIQAMVDDFDVRAHPDGTTVVLGRRVQFATALSA